VVDVEAVSLTALVTEQLGRAGTATTGRSATTVRGGSDTSLRQTLIALLAGQELAEHDNPGEATVQVLVGRIRLVTAQDSHEAAAGDLVTIPPARHALTALEDSAVLLTVVGRV
jgi:quercetin dioxygenase-like cupin family protein